MQTLGERLWGKAVDKQADWKAVHFMLHTYGDEYKDSDKYHNDMKKEQAEAERAYVVNMLAAQKPKDK